MARVNTIAIITCSANCDPITGTVVDFEVTWRGAHNVSQLAYGAVSLVFEVPDDATAFAFSRKMSSALRGSVGLSDIRYSNFIV